jgi:hypothetical protein
VKSKFLFLEIRKKCALVMFVSFMVFLVMRCGKDPVSSDPAPANLRYAKDTVWLFAGTAVAIPAPASSGGAVISYSIAPALPSELQLDITTGAISGTAPQTPVTTTYRVSGSNNAGSTTCSLTVVTADNSALLLISPAGGEQYSLSEPVTVRWITNPDSIGTPVLTSFTRVYSIDSGMNWIPMSYDTKSAVHTNGSPEYQFDWNVLDTSQINPATSAPMTKADFLNKGVLVKIGSYPPNRGTQISGFFFFHE